MFGFLRRKSARKSVQETDASTSPTADVSPAPDAETASQADEPATSPLDTEATAQGPLSEGHVNAEPTSSTLPDNETLSATPTETTEPESREKPASVGAFARLRQQLSRTREGLTSGLGDLILGKKRIDDDLIEEIETRLLMADVGQNTTLALVDELTQRVSRKEITDPENLFETLCELMIQRLDSAAQGPLSLDRPANGPRVVLVCGINGAGKTTTIGKLAHQFGTQDKKVMLAAGDTFRAAAVEQLIAWGQRNDVPVIGEPGRGDAASVLFDAVQSARARNTDILIADTAGRLHTQGGLMDELKKLVRVVGKAQEGAPHEILLVLDASIGQNALNQARQFHSAVGVTGLVITKLDGTAKGGIVFAIADELGLPIRFLGVGERSEDLRPFEARAFVDALLDRIPTSSEGEDAA